MCDDKRLFFPHRLRNENVAVQAHGVVGTTGLLALCHAVVEPKHAPEFTPAVSILFFFSF